MKIIARSILFISSSLSLTAPTNNAVHATTQDIRDEGTGFSAEGMVRLENNLPGNLDIIGAHLHTGSSTTNGPVNIIFCGGSPLPDLLAINGKCNDLFDQRTERNVIEETDWEVLTSKGAWANNANDATSLPNVTSLADGAPTTYKSFMTAINACTKDDCDVYFNIHTNYSFAENEGAFGLARGQLVPVDCPSDKSDGAKCFGGTVTSENTNQVDGLTNQLPMNAGEVIPISGDVLITYIGGDDDGDDDGDDNDNDNDEGNNDNREVFYDDSSSADHSLKLWSMTGILSASFLATFFI